MKKLLLCITFCYLTTFSTSSQQKAFGDINFGMSKKEVKEIYKGDKENHKIEIGGWTFDTCIPDCKFDENGLYLFCLLAEPKHFVAYLDKDNSTQLLMDVREVFTRAGYKVVKEHVYWPNPRLMVRDSYALVMFNEEKEKYMIVKIPNSMKVSMVTYFIVLDFVTKKHADKWMFLHNEKVDNKANEINDIL